MKNTSKDLEARRDLYKLLSMGYNFPNQGMYEEIKNKNYLSRIEKAVFDIDLKIDDDKKNRHDEFLSLKDISYENFEAEYISSFEANIPQPKCSLYEGHYRKQIGRNNVLLELKAFYKNFGLEKAEIFKDSEDHISIELEFMHFLIFKEWQSTTQLEIDKVPYLNCQSDFVDRHLSKWIFEFCKNVKKNVKLGFFLILSNITSELVKSDIKRLNLK